MSDEEFEREIELFLQEEDEEEYVPKLQQSHQQHHIEKEKKKEKSKKEKTKKDKQSNSHTTITTITTTSPSQQQQPALEIYRKSTVGQCLLESLDEMISSGEITTDMAKKILCNFDKVTVICYGLIEFLNRLHVMCLLLK